MSMSKIPQSSVSSSGVAGDVVLLERLLNQYHSLGSVASAIDAPSYLHGSLLG